MGYSQPELKKKTVVLLKGICDELGVAKTGKKDDLIKRILEAQNSDKNNNSSASDSDSVSEQVTPVEAPTKRRSSSTKLTKKKSKVELVDKWGVTYGTRVGPATVFLVQHHGNVGIEGPDHLTISPQGSNYWALQSPMNLAIANCKVSSGKWYFEVNLNSNTQTCIGWCEESFKPNSNNGQSWLWEPTQGRRWQGDTCSDESWPQEPKVAQNGDIIGVGIDFTAKSLKFWQNGKDLGVAFTGLPSSRPLVPCISISHWGRAIVNFGAKAFSHPQPTYLQLHSSLSDNQIEALATLFTHYSKISNADSTDETVDEQLSSQKMNLASSIEIKISTESRKAIFGSGFEALYKDLQVQEEGDSRMFVALWKLDSSTFSEINEDEWMAGWMSYGASTIEEITRLTKKWDLEVNREEKQMHSFYVWLFTYLLDSGATVLAIDVAFLIWDLTLAKLSWQFWEQWTQWLKDTGKTAISKDVWMQLWHFIKTYPTSLDSYDDNGFFPTTFDEFVSHLKKKDKPQEEEEEEED